MSATIKIDCEAEIVKVVDDDLYPGVSRKVKRLEELAPQCTGTGIYESRLGVYLANDGRYEEAENVLRSGLQKNIGYEKQLRLALSGVAFRQGKLSESAEQSLGLIDDFPDWSGGYIALGETRLVQQRFQEGIDNLERANALEPNSRALTLLAIAYYQLNRYGESVIAMQKALKLNRDALKHTQAVCATAFSLVAINQLAAAEDLLVKHLTVQPSARNNPTYQQAVFAVKKKEQEPSAE